MVHRLNNKMKSIDSSDINNTSLHTPNKDTNRGEDASWKVLKNKFLFKLIFSNFKFKELFIYDDLYGLLDFFIKFSNGDAIIRDKIKVEIITDSSDFIFGNITKNIIKFLKIMIESKNLIYIPNRKRIEEAIISSNILELIDLMVENH
ncbi:hypothetical protein DICPUDRAFT_149199 [Dictyostelium purpureum]|uniref:Uncharacterized protein n=1 Tax=Dictyostelium purpureum TaxID=5786 RepID=F0ZD31_DICPU|nr:uncharacterized protein DICPUDRAFT_149199 [Dictyostelium purpureum]EGC38111.1 hypothetical protein DICPUDRAFT_149199 [Dictyostelium purpureum]|eukprot:XP_003285325.1 hypothetical protein DICPUDRAFT_149199 [Dictyostelium purpureum]